MINKFKNIKVAIFGDIMLDKYIIGDVMRISPEAPIPIVDVNKEKYVPGGAANVAANITSLGAKAYLFGITGKDKAGDILIDKAQKVGIFTDTIFKKEEVHTIQKIRIIGQSQQLVRLDYESKNYTDLNINDIFIENLKKINELSAIIISDYAKGTINRELMKAITDFSRIKSIPVFVDPKPINSELYYNAFLITPNLKEAEGLCNMKLDNNSKIEECGKRLLEKYNSNIIITKGANGMSLFGKDMAPIHIGTKAQQVFDVSGAGDTVIAVLCLSIVSDMDLVSAINMANHAAGIKVGKLGTAAVTYQELNNSLKNE